MTLREQLAKMKAENAKLQGQVQNLKKQKGGKKKADEGETKVDRGTYQGHDIVTISWGDREYNQRICFGVRKWAIIEENIEEVMEHVRAILAEDE